MRYQNVAISAAFTLLLYWVYVSRYVLDELVFGVLLFGLIIAGGLFLWRELLSSEKIKHDERTELLAGKAARITMIASFILIIVVMAFLTVSARPTSPIGVLAILVGLLSLIYSLTFAYLEKTH